MTEPATSMRKLLGELRVVRAENDLVYGATGDRYIDLFTGNGAVFLGHVEPTVRDAVREQLDQVWITGALQTPAGLEARALVESFFPPSHRLAGFYSAGAEASEFALRIARGVTGRRGVVGFEGCMHGKSTATAYLGWPNARVTLPDFHRLPYVSSASERDILERVESTLATREIAAVVIEPLQGSAGGHLASPAFFLELTRACEQHGTLLVVDEIFTGFHRTGDAFLHRGLGLSPDIVLIGKAMGNGFPVSGVVLDAKYSVDPAMLPGSTFAGNPLAASAVTATLKRMRALDVVSKVETIEKIIRAELAPLKDAGIVLRGKGALWILELARDTDVDAAMTRIVRGGVLASPTGRTIRLLPAATVRHENLVEACRVVREACLTTGGRR